MNKDLTGQKRGHLTALYPTGEKIHGTAVWVWRCDCGKTVQHAAGRVGTWGGLTMCPDCAYRLKQEQALAMSARIKRDEAGRSVEQVKDIIDGRILAHNSSGVRGVSWHKGSGKWAVRVSNGKGGMRTVGYFTRLEDAAEARRHAVEMMYGTEDK